MLKSMPIHQKDRKRIIKSNFVTSYLTFRGSIPTQSIEDFEKFEKPKLSIMKS